MEESLSSIQPLGGEPKELSSRLPEEYLPTDDELIALVRQRVRLSLREISNRLWPMLPWRPLTPSGDSVTQDLRVFPVGRGTKRMTTAEYLRDRMQDLVIQGHVAFGPLRRDEVDREAQVSYVTPSAR